MDKQKIRNAIGGFRPDNEPVSDNLAIMLCNHYTDHWERPENDPDTEDGWGEWVIEKTNEALDRLTDEVMSIAANGSSAHEG